MMTVTGQPHPHTDQSYWSCLPPELQLQIFRHLSITDLTRLRLVSRSWDAILQDPKVWESQDTLTCRLDRRSSRGIRQLVSALSSSRFLRPFSRIRRLKLVVNASQPSEYDPTQSPMNSDHETYSYLNALEQNLTDLEIKLESLIIEAERHTPTAGEQDSHFMWSIMGCARSLVLRHSQSLTHLHFCFTPRGWNDWHRLSNLRVLTMCCSFSITSYIPGDSLRFVQFKSHSKVPWMAWTFDNDIGIMIMDRFLYRLDSVPGKANPGLISWASRDYDRRDLDYGADYLDYAP